jgi:hypothetical protein
MLQNRQNSYKSLYLTPQDLHIAKNGVNFGYPNRERQYNPLKDKADIDYAVDTIQQLIVTLHRSNVYTNPYTIIEYRYQQLPRRS